MKSYNEDTIVALFGQEYAKAFSDLDFRQVRAIQARLSSNLLGYEWVGNPQSLEYAFSHPPEGGEWWCPAVFDGARTQKLIISPPNYSQAKWRHYLESAASQGLGKGEPYGKMYLQLMRNNTKSLNGDSSISIKDRLAALEQLDLLFELIGESNDERMWNLLEIACSAGQHIGLIPSIDEGKRMALRGLPLVHAQDGRVKGSENKSSKRKAADVVKEEHQKLRGQIVRLWQDHESHDPYEFLSMLKDKGLASEKRDGSYEYQLAGKGGFLAPESCANKIRRWARAAQ